MSFSSVRVSIIFLWAVRAILLALQGKTDQLFSRMHFKCRCFSETCLEKIFLEKICNFWLKSTFLVFFYSGVNRKSCFHNSLALLCFSDSSFSFPRQSESLAFGCLFLFLHTLAINKRQKCNIVLNQWIANLWIRSRLPKGF